MTEFDKIIECMCDNSTTIFTEADKNRDSYWEDKNGDYPCILEYMFDTPVEMLQLMNIYIDNKELQRLIAAHAFTKRTEKRSEHLNSDKNKSEDINLPEYVYVF